MSLPKPVLVILCIFFSFSPTLNIAIWLYAWKDFPSCFANEWMSYYVEREIWCFGGLVSSHIAGLTSDTRANIASSRRPEFEYWVVLAHGNVNNLFSWMLYIHIAGLEVQSVDIHTRMFLYWDLANGGTFSFFTETLSLTSYKIWGWLFLAGTPVVENAGWLHPPPHSTSGMVGKNVLRGIFREKKFSI